MDTPRLRHPKPTATADRAARKRAMQAKDRAESDIVRKRSGGLCEVGYEWFDGPRWLGSARCNRRAEHVHHMIKGRGKRAVGASVLAQHKQHVCHQCHQDIEGGVGGKRLILVQAGHLPVYTDVYRRVR